MNLPENFKENMKYLLGNDDYQNFIDSYNEEYKKGVRINKKKINNEYMEKIFPHLEKVEWCKEGYYFEDENLTKSPFYNAGLYYIQEPSAMSPVSFFPIEENDRVLDLCSAPGGKACQIANKLNNTGLIVANDISPSRCKAIVKNFELQGVTNGMVISNSPEKLKKPFKEFFNKILVDAPCSGEGMFRKDKKVMGNWSKDSNMEYAKIQKDILNSAKDMLTSGGMIMYSTCTFSIEENENVMQSFLEENTNFSLIKVSSNNFNFISGFSNNSNYNMENCLRLLPHKIKGEGHFFALLKKEGEYENKVEEYNDIEKIEEIQSFIKNNFKKDFSLNGKIIKHENSLFLRNIKLPNLEKIRIMKSGFYLGDVKNKKFIPSQAFAMSLKKEDFNNRISYNESDNNLIKYLRGETIFHECKDGYVLICLHDFPIGFGIGNNGKIKNKYPLSFILK